MQIEIITFLKISLYILCSLFLSFFFNIFIAQFPVFQVLYPLFCPISFTYISSFFQLCALQRELSTGMSPIGLCSTLWRFYFPRFQRKCLRRVPGVLAFLGVDSTQSNSICETNYGTKVGEVCAKTRWDRKLGIWTYWYAKLQLGKLKFYNLSAQHWLFRSMMGNVDTLWSAFIK